MTRPFTWEAYADEFDHNPEFDLFAKFSFDHLSEFEREQIGRKLYEMAEFNLREAKKLEAYMREREKNKRHLELVR